MRGELINMTRAWNKEFEITFFFVPRSYHVDQFTFNISLPSLKFAIFIHLSLLTTTSIVLILEVCGTPVTHELG